MVYGQSTQPLQPMVTVDGVLRFQENPIVKFLLDQGPFDMNSLMLRTFEADDREQFAQLIGYSVAGFHELPYVSDMMHEQVDEAQRALVLVYERSTLVKKIREWIRKKDPHAGPADFIIAGYLQYFFDKVVKENYGQGISIAQLLPEYIVEAFELLATSEETAIVAYRQRLMETFDLREIPDLLDIRGGLDRQMLVMKISFLIGKIVQNKFIEKNVEAYLFAQDKVLDHALHKFNRRVYRTNLWKMMEDSSERGFSGKFGSTTLRTYYMAGRTMLTFAREPVVEVTFEGDDSISFPDELQIESSVTFVADASDSTGLRTGLQSCYADITTAVAMIEEVICNWPKTIDEQVQIFAPDREVSIGF